MRDHCCQTCDNQSDMIVKNNCDMIVGKWIALSYLLYRIWNVHVVTVHQNLVFFGSIINSYLINDMQISDSDAHVWECDAHVWDSDSRVWDSDVMRTLGTVTRSLGRARLDIDAHFWDSDATPTLGVVTRKFRILFTQIHKEHIKRDTLLKLEIVMNLLRSLWFCVLVNFLIIHCK